MRNEKARVPDPNEFVSNPGTEYELEYSSKVMPDGTIKLQPSGKINLKEMINSQRESTDIAYIIQQLENGNRDVINPTPGFYADCTKFPKTYAEFLQARIDAEADFYKMPVEIRQKFDNDFNQYFASVGDPEWFEKLGVAGNEEVKEKVKQSDES